VVILLRAWAACEGEETVAEPAADEAVIFEEFFTVGLRMPPHSELLCQNLLPTRLPRWGLLCRRELL
jgi:hypothetical protein